MLIEFGVGNYRSFRDRVRFSLTAARITSKYKELDKNNVFTIDGGLKLLRSAAIYGANASGKSNFTSALRFMRQMVLGSSKETQASEPIAVEIFRLDSGTLAAPAFFEIVFLLDNKKYRYGFEVTSQEIISEWLSYVPKTREAKLFTRNSNKIHVSNGFKEGKGIPEKTRDNALFLSVVAQFNGEIAQGILSWFKALNVISGLNDGGYRGYTLANYQKDEYKDDILGFVRNLDLGIDDIEVEEQNFANIGFPTDMPDPVKKYLADILKDQHQMTVSTMHRMKPSRSQEPAVEKFNLDRDESEGTKKLFYLAGPLLDTLSKGMILVVDELDARLHPLITYAIIGLFNSKESNRHNAQLIFTTHDTNLLSNKIFRRDQIWFTEKNRQGSTDLYSLVEFKVRSDASFDTDYIKGKYGAIPFIGDLHRLLGTNNGKEETC